MVTTLFLKLGANLTCCSLQTICSSSEGARIPCTGAAPTAWWPPRDLTTSVAPLVTRFHGALASRWTLAVVWTASPQLRAPSSVAVSSTHARWVIIDSWACLCYSSSSASYPTLMCGRCFWPVTSTQPSHLHTAQSPPHSPVLHLQAR